MFFFLSIVGVILHIISANNWIIVPWFCIAFCYFMSFFSWIIYSYAKGITSELNNTNRSGNNDRT